MRTPSPAGSRMSLTVPGWHERLLRVLRVDAAFDRASRHDDVLLAQAQPVAAGHRQLEPDQVHAGDGFRDRMLDLDARVHFDEEEFAGLAVHDELQRARATVLTARASARPLAHALPRLVDSTGDGLFLQQLLVAALDRALLLAQVDDVLPSPNT